MYRSVLQQHSGSDSCLEAKIFYLCTNIHIYKALFFVTSLALATFRFCQGTIIGSISIQRRIFVKKQRILSPDKKIVGPQNFSMASLKFSDA